MHTDFDEDYFLRGKQSGKSNYEDYRWLEEPTMALARAACHHMKIMAEDTLLDYGAARGYFVKAMRRLGVQAWGYDISAWAVNNCDPEVATYMTGGLQPPSLPQGVDHVWAKDVFEHMHVDELQTLLDGMIPKVRKGMLAIVPLAVSYGQRYIRDEDNQDSTHKLRWDLQDWMDFMSARIKGHPFILRGSWHLPGLKPASCEVPRSCGFLQLERVR